MNARSSRREEALILSRENSELLHNPSEEYADIDVRAPEGQGQNAY